MDNLAMRLLGIIISCNLCWALPKDMVIQFHSTVVDGAETVHVLVNGVILSNAGEEANGIPNALWADQTMPEYRTIERIRECRMHGVEVYLTDHILYDGRIYLTLDVGTDTWTSEVQKAVALKLLWDQDPERTRQERMQLQEGCIKMMKQLTRSESKMGGMSVMTVLYPALAFMALVVLTLISFLISKKQGHPGGVIGSIVHYSHDIKVPPQEGKDYQVL